MTSTHNQPKVAVVTGAGSGIGSACAGMLAEAGYRVVVADISLTKAEERARSSPLMEACHLDVRNAKEVADLFSRLSAEFGGVDILVHCAGSTLPGKNVWDMEEADFQSLIQTHLVGSFLCVKEASRNMVSRQFGRIVLIGSMAGISGLYGKSHYASVKAGMCGLTLTVAKEFIGTGVTINLIAPGLIVTPMSQRSFGDVPLTGGGTPEDVAALVKYLTSREASHINGTIIPFDGGQSLMKAIDVVMRKQVVEQNKGVCEI
jgi:3-oxoacyl-[acyl-carrier protein] reductase